ncbi:MAG: hypothetical protein PWP24_1210 [Clostridiales bacterium]|nr:hypothetical protein [Clostridiales bacterium]
MDFEQLYQVYYMKLYHYLFVLTHNSDLAEELTQKTFFKVLHKNTYRGDSNEFTWLCAIAKNLYVDETREWKKKEPMSEEIPTLLNLEHVVEDEDTMLRIHQILHVLEEPYKEVFQLRVFGELSFQKIGLIFAKSETWARVTYHRARLKMQERMDKQ